MGGFFGVASRESAVFDLFYGTDYHSHLGTRRAGMATALPQDSVPSCSLAVLSQPR